MARIPYPSTLADRDTATAQLLAITTAVYLNRRDAVEQLIGLDGAISAWVYRPDSWPPSYCLITQPGGPTWLIMAGTVNAGQWAGHLQGTFGATAIRSGGAVNGQWASVASQVVEEIAPLLPTGPERQPLCVGGHSYGGAVAQVIAYGLAQNPAVSGTALISYGAPKCFEDGITDPPPDRQYRWRSMQDPIPYTPPSNDEAAISPWVRPAVWRLGTLHWTHYGEDVWLAPTGTSNPLDPTPDPLPPGVSVGLFTEHNSLNYWGRFRARAALFGISSDGADAINLAGDLLGLPATQALVERLPESVPGPDGLPFRPPVFNTFGSGGGSNVPTYPEIVLPSNPMRVTFDINVKSSGWSESYVINVESGDKWQMSAGWAQAYAVARRQALSNYATLIAWRTSQEDVVGDSERAADEARGCGAGDRAGAAANPEGCWWMECKDSSRVVRSEHPMHGWAEAGFPDTARFGCVPAGATEGKAHAQLLLQKLRPLLCDDWKGEGVFAGGKVRALIPFLTRNPASIVSRLVTGAHLDDVGRIVVTVPGAPDDFTIGATYHLTHKRKRGVTGVAGPATLVKIELVGSGLVGLTLDKQLRIIPGVLEVLSVRLLEKKKEYCKINSIDFLRATNRNLGRPTLATVGHRARR